MNKNMKKIINTTILFCTLLIAVSCNDFLDVESPSAFDSDYVFSNAGDAKKMVLGVYALFSQDTYTSRMSNVFMQNTDVEANEPAANPDGSRRDVWSLQGGLLQNFGDILKCWNDNYLAIERANQCIEGIEASEEYKKGNSDMKMLLGEAYCLRAYRYFLLCNYWGDVPYHRESAKAGMQLDKPRTDKNIIYSGMIQDLIDHEEGMYFADQYPDGIERMNREFCLGFIARLALFRAGYGMTKEGIMKRADEYLDLNNDSLAVTYTIDGVTKTARTYKEYYQLAKDYTQKLISLRGRELNPNYAQIFENQSRWITTVNDDVLYEVAFTNINGGGDVGWCIGVTVSNSSKGSGSSYICFTPTYYYSFDENDRRLPITISMVNYSSDTQQNMNSITKMTPGKWNRLLVPADLGPSSSKSTGINWPLMRYSDILLMLAEAENELNGPTSLAKEMLTKVRNRAFAPEDRTEKVINYINALNSKEKFFEAIVNERAWEFGGECLRKFDLVRWNNYGERIVRTKQDLNNIGKAAYGLEVENPEVAQYAHYADVLYYTRNNGTISILNPRYKVEIVPENIVPEADLDKTPGAYASMNWCKNLYRKITDSKTGEVTYEPATFTERSWRGYTDPTGISAVPYLLPIPAQVVGASKYLDNNGYGHVLSSN